MHKSSAIDGVYWVDLKLAKDSRGYFAETFRDSWLPTTFKARQNNFSYSKAGVLRGMHYHLHQDDFWVVPHGLVQVGLYDLRASAPTQGKNFMFKLGLGHDFGLFIPRGVAHGFYAYTDSFMTYCVNEHYNNTDENGVYWDDPALGLSWANKNPMLSIRDSENPKLNNIDRLWIQD